MDVLKVLKAQSGDAEHRENLVRYMLDDRKLDCGGKGVNYTDPEQAIAQMEFVAKYFDKEHRCPFAQLILSFDGSVTDQNEAIDLVKQAADQIPDEFQSMYCVHDRDEESGGLHGHIMVNTISTRNGRQFDTSKEHLEQLCQDISAITGNETSLILGRKT